MIPGFSPAATDGAANDADHAPARIGGTLWQRFSVSYDFPVSFTHDLFASDNPLLADILRGILSGFNARADVPADDRSPHALQHTSRPAPQPALRRRPRLLVFVDAGVVTAMPALPGRIEAWFAARTAQLDLVAAPLVIRAGEALKSEPAALEPMRQAIHHHAIDRHSTVLAIGGGALLDAAGLVAATAHRGVRHVRVPTTVLSQNDSGVGVKNGINRYGQKNWLGTFAPPDAVINDAAFLTALPPRERRAGMAEAVKVALIRDAGFFDWLERHAAALAAFEMPAVTRSIRRCAELHMQQIGTGGDPFERGSARPLDFGHWAAHRLESLVGATLRHGEAVAIGIALDSLCSVSMGLLPAGEELRIVRLLHALGFTLWHEALEHREVDGTSALCRGLEDFRIHLGGELTITLLAGIGRGVEVHELPEAVVLSALDWLRTLTAQELSA